jgi:hypothetical protein
MWPRNSFLIGLAALTMWGQPSARSVVNGRIELPPDAPLAVMMADWSGSSVSVRGGAMVLDVHASLSLRNAGGRRVRGVTLLVSAQEVTAGGRASVTVPTLDAAPGETFPVRVDLRLLKPQGASPTVEIGLDGVLFDDLSFFGPDKLKSRRALTAWELEARRDRQYFKALLEKQGGAALQSELVQSAQREKDRARPGVQMVRGGRLTAQEEKQVEFAFLKFPDAPVESVGGQAAVADNEARAPRFAVRNRGLKPIDYLEIGWLVRDQQGRQFLAGSMPSDTRLAPGQQAEIAPDTRLRFPAGMQVSNMTGYLTSVQFSDGQMWIPSRAQLNDARLRGLLPPSPEEQRLVQIYQRRGLQAVIDELKRF